jgi:hypothetical protein
MSLLVDRAWLALSALAEAAPGNVVSDQLLAAAPSVQHLSLRNQLILLIQAGERRLRLRDVDTEQGWARRGRVPTQPGLRVVRPHDERGWAGERQFRISYRWDFTQTGPVRGTVVPEAEPRAAGVPERFAAGLIDQLGTYGYRVAPASATAVDHEARLVAIDKPTWHGDAVAVVHVLIPALAHALVTETGGGVVVRDCRTG